MINLTALGAEWGICFVKVAIAVSVAPQGRCEGRQSRVSFRRDPFRGRPGARRPWDRRDRRWIRGFPVDCLFGVFH